MEGYQVATINQVVAEIDISVTTTGNFKTIILKKTDLSGSVNRCAKRRGQGCWNP